MDRFDLYEITVQSPARLVSFLRAIHGRQPRVLGEDFSGTAAVSRAWVAAIEGGHAIAIDHDAEALARARSCAGLRAILGDVRTCPDAERDAADVIFAGNFSLGEWHTRADLVAYLRRARARLYSHGVFVCDTYGGASAFQSGAVERLHPAPDGALVRYTWEQRSADPLTAEVVNALHFRVERAGEIVQEITDAFVYRWRLWSVPELRDALSEAGFARTEVQSDLPDAAGGADDRSLRSADARDLGESFILCVIGRT
jgi:hypothetical protein